MGSSIEVRITGRGSVRDGKTAKDSAMEARCDLCAQAVDAVASLSAPSPADAATGAGPFACKDCLRTRLEAMTVGAWQLKEAGETGLPWGKISG
jgi:hypothetical protein